MRFTTNAASAALALFLAAGAVVSASAQECSPVVLSQLYEEVLDVAVDGNIAAVANGENGVLIIDLSVPSNPVVAAALSIPTENKVVAVSLPYLYSIGDDGLLRCFDVTNPSAPVARGSIAAASTFQARQIAVEGDTVFVLGASNFNADDFRSFSFADPDSPVLLDGIELAERGFGLDVRDGIAVIAQETDSAVFVDVSDPGSLSLIATRPISFFSFYASAAMTTNAAVVSDSDDNSFTGGYRVFDLTDPQNPVEVFSDFSVGYVTDIAAVGDLVYISSDLGVSIVDVSVPSAPATLGLVSSGSEQALSIAAAGSTLVQGRMAAGMVFNDVSNPAAPAVLAEYNPGITSGYEVVLDGDIAFVAEIGTLWSVDISDRMNPIILDSVSGLGGAPHLALAGDTLYYGTSFSSLGTRIIDVSDPSNLINTGRLAGSDTSPSVINGLLYTRTSAGYVVYDITNPLSPSQIATFPVSPGFGGALVSNGSLGVAVGSSSGIELFDVTDPFNASAYTTLDTPGFANHAAVGTGYAYVSDGSPGMQVVDVANPAAPSIVSVLDTPSFTKRITLDGTFAYISQSLGLVLADISNPLSPQMITEFRNFGQFSVSQPNDAAVVDDIAVVAEQFNGLLLVDFSSCTSTPPCPGDIADDFGTLGGDGMVSFGDFLALLGLVGSCPGGMPGCDGDIADDFGTLGGDGMVSFGDFLALLGLVGPCP